MSHHGSHHQAAMMMAASHGIAVMRLPACSAEQVFFTAASEDFAQPQPTGKHS